MKKKKFWRKKLKWFLVKHPYFEDNEYEQIYTPKEGIKFKFWIEGNLQIEGINEELEINYNDPDLLVLSKIRKTSNQGIFRIPWSRVIAVELTPINEKDMKIQDLLRINPAQSN